MMNDLDQAFADPNPSVRLKAALAAGIEPSLSRLDTLIHQCAFEEDFQVREMLTWALIRLPADVVVPRLVDELSRKEAQARRQALHTLSKFRDPSAWQAVRGMLDDEDHSVVRTAWYAAVALVPEGQRQWLAEKLAMRLGLGDEDVRLSLSRALIGLGEDAIGPVLSAAAQNSNEQIRKHAETTNRLLQDPDAGFAISHKAARKEVALGKTRSSKG